MLLMADTELCVFSKYCVWEKPEKGHVRRVSRSADNLTLKFSGPFFGFGFGFNSPLEHQGFYSEVAKPHSLRLFFLITNG